MKAAAPTKLPATALTPAALEGLEPLPEVLEAPAPEPPLPEAPPLPPVVEADAVAPGPLMTTVVLLLALTTRVWVPLTLVEGPPMMMVWMPVPTAGMEAGSGWAVTTAGCEFWGAGMAGMLVWTAGIPVTTPSELVWARKDVWGKGSMEDESAEATAKAAAEMKKVEARILTVCWCELKIIPNGVVSSFKKCQRETDS